MDVTFQIMDVTVCEKDKEISDVQNINSLFLLSFPQTLENWPLVLKLALSFPFSAERLEIVFLVSSTHLEACSVLGGKFDRKKKLVWPD